MFSLYRISFSLALLTALSLSACMDDDSPGVMTRPVDLPLTAVPPPPITPLPSQMQDDLVPRPQITSSGYTTLLGTTGEDLGNAISADNAGNAYITGTTDACGTSNKIYAAKLNTTGTLIYFVCLYPNMGSNNIASDSNGNAYIVSGNMLSKINATGTSFVYNLSLAPWRLTGVAVDSLGNAYVTGRLSGSADDVVVAKVNPGGTAFVYAVSFGGSRDDIASGLAIDNSGNVYVVGSTNSTDYPLSNAIQTTLRGIQDSFVTKLDSTGTRILYSTYLGGNNADSGGAIAVDNAGSAYVTGSIVLVNDPGSFPVTSGAAQFFPPGGNDGYVAKLNTNGGLAFSTYVGGSGGDLASGIAVDRITGSAVLTGSTLSTNFPTAGTTPATTLVGMSDAFVVQLNPAGSAFSYARYLGGNSTEIGFGVAMDSSAAVYVTGATSSSTFPTSGRADHSDSDIYVVKFNP